MADKMPGFLHRLIRRRHHTTPPLPRTPALSQRDTVTDAALAPWVDTAVPSPPIVDQARLSPGPWKNTQLKPLREFDLDDDYTLQLAVRDWGTETKSGTYVTAPEYHFLLRASDDLLRQFIGGKHNHGYGGNYGDIKSGTLNIASRAICLPTEPDLDNLKRDLLGWLDRLRAKIREAHINTKAIDRIIKQDIDLAKDEDKDPLRDVIMRDILNHSHHMPIQPPPKPPRWRGTPHDFNPSLSPPTPMER